MKSTNETKHVVHEVARAELDPMFYADIESFRNAVADGTVNPDKGCRDMKEYLWSVSHASV